MAVKKTTKASAPKAAKKKVVAKAAAKKTVAAKTAKTTPKKAAKKKPAAVKLGEKQAILLKKIADTKEGYFGAKGEAKVLESLQTKKLIKRGKKDKEKGYNYTVSKAGVKHLSSPPPAPPSA
jgi:hypothetical protein